MRFFAFILFVLAFASGATVYGEIYNSDDFETVSPVILKISGPFSTQIIVRDGNYSIDLPVGVYTLAGFYYENSTLVYRSYDKINISDDNAQIHFDIVLFEPEEFELFYSSIEPLEIESQLEHKTDDSIFTNADFLWYVLFILFICIVVLYFFNKKKVTHSKDLEQNKPVDAESELDEEEQKLLSLLEANEGRALQRDLRKELGFSEAKMSLMIDDLESRGFVKRIKKGRGNIIKLVRGMKWSA